MKTAFPGLSLINSKNNILANTPVLKNGQGSFLAYLNNAIKEVDQLQKEASTSAVKLSMGEEEYLHNTMLAYEKANLALQLTIEIRNKLVEAYQEIMRIQM